MLLLFRIDDIYINGLDFEDRLFSVFEKNNINLAIGVIPFDIYDKPHSISIPLCINSRFIEICVHGYNHSMQNSIFNRTEFLGLSYEEQLNKTLKAKLHLEKITNSIKSTFIPPFNKCDINTLRALNENGYKQIMLGQTYIDKCDVNIQQILTGFENFNFFDTFIFKVISSKIFDLFMKNILLVVLFHPYDFSEVKGEYFKNDGKTKIINLKKLDKILLYINNKKLISILPSHLENKTISKSQNVYLKILSKIIKYRYGYRVLFQRVS